MYLLKQQFEDNLVLKYLLDNQVSSGICSRLMRREHVQQRDKVINLLNVSYTLSY